MTQLPEDCEPELVNRIIAGDRTALAELFDLHRNRLWRIVNFRLDSRLRGRVDADDILQEAWLDAVRRMDRFLKEASQSCFVWLRLIVTQTLADVHRAHLGTQKRDAGRDRSIHRPLGAGSTAASLSSFLSGRLTSPSGAAIRAEQGEIVDAAVESMPELDREVLALRHFEELSNRETACVLEISEQAASMRYVRALGRLKEALRTIQNEPEKPPSE
ncbi:MAG: sigma-70 family RNA polymerase sigma factor [Planctomycetaceae bacterium]|nr:sigma-70 family RNA polymerase sigma factor [Planctomycetaceae bacterium]